MVNPFRSSLAKDFGLVALLGLVAAVPGAGHAQSVQRVSPKIEVSGSIGIGAVASRRSAATVGGRATFRPWLPLGIEVDVSRSLGADSAGDRRGHGSPITVSVNATYFFGNARAQPFLSGGTGTIWSRPHPGYAVGIGQT